MKLFTFILLTFLVLLLVFTVFLNTECQKVGQYGRCVDTVLTRINHVITLLHMRWI